MAKSTPGYVSPDSPRGQKLARLAVRQHGVVATSQLLRLSFSSTTVFREMEAGRLHRVHRGVYAVGHVKLTRRGRWMAAVLACGEEAALSHHAAAALCELRPSAAGLIDVTAGGRSRRRLAGVNFHSARTLDPRDVTVRDGIPVTTVARTLLDLAELLDPQWLRITLEVAERRHLLDLNEIHKVIARNQGRHGIKPLCAALAAQTGSPPWTQSELENAFLTLIRAAALPEPQCNVLILGELVDCFGPHPPLVVELDGLEFHRTRKTFEDDRRRDVKFQLAGIPLLRFTQPRLEHQPRIVISAVSTMLTRSQTG